MDFNVQTFGQRLFFFVRRSTLLRTVAAMPVISPFINRICRKLLQPTPGYSAWINQRVIDRTAEYACVGEPGLLSFLTTVWNTPLDLLRTAVESLLNVQTVREFEWVVLDNGCTRPEVIEYLKQIAAGDPRVIYLRVDKNLGIIGGMHLALSHSTGRYILPFDSDDLLYPDAVAIMTHQLRANKYPPAMYTDEDKLDEKQKCWPYFKPDWDPVLFLNSCYVAHLGCLDRRLAIELKVYTNAACEGCHDWDSFLRFHLAGHVPVHVSEIVYSWRMHARSTAGNVRSKNFIYESQRSLLQYYLSQISCGKEFVPRLSPLFKGTPDWHLQRQPNGLMPITRLRLANTAIDARGVLPQLSQPRGLIAITWGDVEITSADWPAEATGLLERHTDIVMIGGRILNARGSVVDGPRVPDFADGFGCPDQGRDVADPGNMAEMWKQRTVSGVSACLCVMRIEFLRQIFELFPNHFMSWPFMGAWAALAAWRQNQRIVYTPFLTGQCKGESDMPITEAEQQAWKLEAATFLKGSRYYNRHLSLTQPYQPQKATCRT